MPGVYDGLLRQGEESVADRLLDQVYVGEGAPSGPGATDEEGVTREDATEIGCVEAAGPRRMAGRVQDRKLT